MPLYPWHKHLKTQDDQAHADAGGRWDDEGNRTCPAGQTLVANQCERKTWDNVGSWGTPMSEGGPETTTPTTPLSSMPEPGSLITPFYDYTPPGSPTRGRGTGFNYGDIAKGTVDPIYEDTGDQDFKEIGFGRDVVFQGEEGPIFMEHYTTSKTARGEGEGETPCPEGYIPLPSGFGDQAWIQEKVSQSPGYGSGGRSAAIVSGHGCYKPGAAPTQGLGSDPWAEVGGQEGWEYTGPEFGEFQGLDIPGIVPGNIPSIDPQVTTPEWQANMQEMIQSAQHYVEKPGMVEEAIAGGAEPGGGMTVEGGPIGPAETWDPLVGLNAGGTNYVVDMSTGSVDTQEELSHTCWDGQVVSDESQCPAWSGDTQICSDGGRITSSVDFWGNPMEQCATGSHILGEHEPLIDPLTGAGVQKRTCVRPNGSTYEIAIDGSCESLDYESQTDPYLVPVEEGGRVQTDWMGEQDFKDYVYGYFEGQKPTNYTQDQWWDIYGQYFPNWEQSAKKGEFDTVLAEMGLLSEELGLAEEQFDIDIDTLTLRKEANKEAVGQRYSELASQSLQAYMGGGGGRGGINQLNTLRTGQNISIGNALEQVGINLNLEQINNDYRDNLWDFESNRLGMEQQLYDIVDSFESALVEQLGGFGDPRLVAGGESVHCPGQVHCPNGGCKDTLDECEAPQMGVGDIPPTTFDPGTMGLIMDGDDSTMMPAGEMVINVTDPTADVLPSVGATDVATFNYSTLGTDLSVGTGAAGMAGGGGGGAGGGGTGGAGGGGISAQNINVIVQQSGGYGPPSNPNQGVQMGPPGSDRRLKENISKIGESPSGLNIYNFNYIGQEGTYEGVMSDEIPSRAVTVDSDGYDRVDYSQIDVNFRRI